VGARLRIGSGGEPAETAAIGGTGFEAEEPELLLALQLAERLDLYPPSPGSILQEYGTPAGAQSSSSLPPKSP